jgi:hypothetical protein
MKRPLRVTALALLLVLSLVAVGCGGDGRLSKDDYIKQAEAIGNRAEKEAGSIDIQNAKSPADLVAGFKKLQAEVDKARKDAAGLKPPKDVEQAHDKQLEAFSITSRDLGELIKAVEAKDEKRIQQLVSSGLPSQAAQRANDDAQRIYKDKGYDALAKNGT